MGRTSARQQRQRRISVFESAHAPLHEQLEKGEERVESERSQDRDDEGDQEMSQAGDSGSIPTTMGVRVSFLDKDDDWDNPKASEYAHYRPPFHRAPSKGFRDFVIPQTPLEMAAAATAGAALNGLQDMQQDKNDDDISVLTEYSGMEEEEDASSQVTSGTDVRTVVTNTTGSRTVPTRNAGQEATIPNSSQQQQKLSKRRNVAIDKLNGFPPFDNSQYKRRRMR